MKSHCGVRHISLPWQPYDFNLPAKSEHNVMDLIYDLYSTCYPSIHCYLLLNVSRLSLEHSLIHWEHSSLIPMQILVLHCSLESSAARWECPSNMPVAIRKRSWEAHVTHRSGLQYSYDDLDLVCCHGVESKKLWMGSGASQEGRWARCASLPDGCYQLPADDLTPISDATTSSGHHDEPSIAIIPPDMPEEVIDVSHELTDVDIDHLQTEINGNSEELNSSIEVSCSGMVHATDREIVDIGVDGVDTENNRNHGIHHDESVFKNSHISREPQQCVSIFSNNGPPLSESVAEQPGKLPTHQETKTNHTDNDSRRHEIPEDALKCFSPGLEPQTELPGTEEEMISTLVHDGANVTLTTATLHGSTNVMEDATGMTRTKENVAPVVTLVREGGWDKGGTQMSESSDMPGGLNESGTRGKSTGPNANSRDIQDGKQNHQACAEVLDHGYEICKQTFLECCTSETTATRGPQAAKAESSRNPSEGRYGPLTPSVTCSSMTANSQVTSGYLGTGCFEGNPKETNNTRCTDMSLKTTLAVRQPADGADESSLSTNLAGCEDEGCSKLDTIQEYEACDVRTQSLQKNPVKTPGALSHMEVEHTATEQYTQNLPRCATEVDDQLLPDGLHSNKSSWCFSESPASKVADGQTEYHMPAFTVSRMEWTDETVQTAINSDTRLGVPLSGGKGEPGEQNEDQVVKVHTRKVSSPSTHLHWCVHPREGYPSFRGSS